MAAVFLGKRLSRLMAVAAALAACLLSSAVNAALLTTIVSFDETNGRWPFAGLTADSAGNLYGSTVSGGRYGFGTIFKIDPVTGAFTTLVTFGDYTNGSLPFAGLSADSMGNLYGTTSLGGSNIFGTVFKLDQFTGDLTTLLSFSRDRINGNYPSAVVIADTVGNLFGTTRFGGAFDLGTIFKLDPTSGIFTTLASFDGAIGAYPQSGLSADAAGNLYGTTPGNEAYGKGTIFKLDSNTGVLTTLVAFSGSNGNNPHTDLIADAFGSLYGTTVMGGTNDLGTIFKFDPVTGDLTTLVSFDGTNGAYPFDGLIADAAGNLYGTGKYGGAYDVGMVYKFDSATGVLTTLASFNGANGIYPESALIADAAGNLYGTTPYGGSGNAGTVYKITDAGFVVPEPIALSLVLLLGGLTSVNGRAR